MKTVKATLTRLLPLMAVLVAACGGDGESEATIAQQLRGTLAGTPERTAVLSAPALDTLLRGTAIGKAALSAGGAPACGVEVLYFTYRTVGARGEAATSTAALMLPTGTGAKCQGPRPLLLYAHGTSGERSYNIAKLGDVDNNAHDEGVLSAGMFAGQGYIVVASNYAGYDSSSLPYHPYLNADQQGKEMLDVLKAARAALPARAADSGKVLITGYSQGGYVAMAAHKAMQEAGMPVVASAPLGSPSALSLLTDYAFMGLPPLGGTLFIPMLATSWQQQFGNVYNSTADLFEDAYATGIDTLLPSAMTSADLVANNKIPLVALFPADAVPGPLVPALGIFYGNGNLVRKSMVTAAAADYQANPCPGNALPGMPAYPGSLNAAKPLDCRPELGFRAAAVANDLRNWVPKRPMMMCGGSGDPVVNFTSMQATMGYFLANGGDSSQLTLVDLENPAQGGADTYAAAKQVFADSKAALAPDLIVRSYHWPLAALPCHLAARQFFDRVLASGQ